MQQLQFVELDEGGRLVVSTEDGTRYAVPVDDRLRAALRPRPATPPVGRGTPGVSLREVQSMIRAGQSAEEVAAVTGWEADRVRRYEGPVLAEREHVIGLARRAAVRSQGRTDGSHTLGDRVQERLQGRDVDLSGVGWDAARGTAHGPWTVQVIFSAGGRERRGTWHYDLQSRGLEALDDEARWLSEDEQALPGGLAGHPLLGAGHGEDEVAADLMATMRERRQRRSRRPRKASGEAVSDPGQLIGHVPGQQAIPPEVLPLEDLAYDPDTMGDPPAAHPGGAAPESPMPPTAAAEQVPDVEEGEDEAPAPAARPAGQPRRRLRLPTLPEPVDPPAQTGSDEEGDEVYARLRHPDEVSFEEFFDMAEDSDSDEDENENLDDGPDEADGVDEADEAADEQIDEPAAAEGPAAEDAPQAEEPDEEPAQQPTPPAGGRKGRTSVPSWDDIMFGARDRS